MCSPLYLFGMNEVNSFQSPHGRTLAYVQSKGAGPGVVFLGGFRSDMTGTKAVHLEAWAKARDRAFLRFDYSGHGQSGGRFDEGTIGQWAEDAADIITTLTDGPQILVGSSMGGWISLLMAKRHAVKVAGMVTIAAAPDFTETMRQTMSPLLAAGLKARGRVQMPSEYGEPYTITRRFLDEGKDNLILPDGLALTIPARFLQGTADVDVPVTTAMTLIERVTGPDIRLTLVKGADHRFSTPECLDLITETIDAVLRRV